MHIQLRYLNSLRNHNKSEFQRILTNLINNSIEATETDKPYIIIKIEVFKNQLEAANIYINARPMLVDITVSLGGIKDSAYPAGCKYYPQELVYGKYIYDGTPLNLDKIK